MGVKFELEISASPAPAAVRESIINDPGFGHYFTDHMARVVWTEALGWHDPMLVPYQALAMDPASNVLHYGQSIFEGLKAYRQPDGSIATFRPARNAARFRRSARRLAMPPLPEELFLGSIDVLLSQDHEWVPGGEDRALYLRPFMFSTEIGLGVRPANRYMYLLIASPAGAYFTHGIKPVSVWLCDDYVRAVAGGTGEAKCAGNYAASLVAQAEAIENQCDQVVWLDAAEHRWVEEMGGMNLFFVYGSGANARLITPPLTGALLPGITRESLLEMAPKLGYPVAEERISTDGWFKDCESGELTEVFACGTAAVITPVGHVKSRTRKWTVGDGTPGPVTLRLREALTGIHDGTAPDEFGWMHRLGPW